MGGCLFCKHQVHTHLDPLQIFSTPSWEQIIFPQRFSALRFVFYKNADHGLAFGSSGFQCLAVQPCSACPLSLFSFFTRKIGSRSSTALPGRWMRYWAPRTWHRAASQGLLQGTGIWMWDSIETFGALCPPRACLPSGGGGWGLSASFPRLTSQPPPAPRLSLAFRPSRPPGVFPAFITLCNSTFMGPRVLARLSLFTGLPLHTRGAPVCSWRPPNK